LSRYRHWPIAALRSWSARRHGRDLLPLIVDRRRIYILPSGAGLAFAALVAVMSIAALNYASNLGLAFAFLLAGIGLVGMHHCHRNLLGLHVDADAEADGFAGAPLYRRCTLANESALDRHDIEIRCAAAGATISLPAGAARALQLPLTESRRGIRHYRHFELRTRFPFGWFRAWTYVQAPLTAYVAPRPVGSRRPPAAAAARSMAEAANRDLAGDADFAGLRPYAPGMALKHMAWKVLARGGEAAVQSYAGAAGEPQWLDWDCLGGLPAEERLSQLCLWVVDSDAQRRPYGLRLPGREIAPAAGALHRRACLRALAAFEDGAERGISRRPS